MESTTVLIVIFSRTVFSIITVVSNVEETLINGTAFFNCSTSLTSGHVDWFFGSDVIYSYGNVHLVYTDRFRVEVYTTNNGFKHFNLILWPVTKDYAGQYICKDSDNVDDKGEEVNLIVLETGPNCAKDGYSQEVIGPNSCGIEQEMVHLSCSVEYSGNKPPSLLWKKVGENNSMEPVLCFDSGHSYTCNLTLKSDLQIEGSSYICQTNGSAMNEYNCTSDHIKIIYALRDYTEINATVNDLASCTIKSSRACSYAWKFNNSEQSISVSQDVNLTKAGSYSCQAICPMRDRNCPITVKTVLVSPGNITEVTVAPTSDFTITRLIIIIIVVVAVVIISVLVVVLLYWKREVICKHCKRNETGQSHLDASEAEPQELESLSPGAVNSEAHLDASEAEPQELESLSPGAVNSEAIRHQNVNVDVTEILIDDVAGAREADPAEIDSPSSSADNSKGKSSSISTNCNGNYTEIASYKERIRGLTLLNNTLYVSIERRQSVQVFDSESMTKKTNLTLVGLQEPGTMASCTIHNCIYIIDKKLGRNHEVFKYCPENNSQSTWLTDFYGRLSVTKATGNVVLAIYSIYGSTDTSMLKIFSTNGELLRTVRFSKNTEIEYVFHAVELNQGDLKGDFVVCQGCCKRNSYLHRVCRVSKDGNIIERSFGEKRGSHTDELDEPSFMVVTVDGSILVTDTRNHRVLLLSKDLKFKKTIFKKGPHLPETMCFDEQRNRLFIGSNLENDRDGRVLYLMVEQ